MLFSEFRQTGDEAPGRGDGERTPEQQAAEMLLQAEQDLDMEPDSDFESFCAQIHVATSLGIFHAKARMLTGLRFCCRREHQHARFALCATSPTQRRCQLEPLERSPLGGLCRSLPRPEPRIHAGVIITLSAGTSACTICTLRDISNAAEMFNSASGPLGAGHSLGTRSA